LFAEHGPEAVTMRQLAAELGCSPMTPYRYFRDKDEILAAVRASAFDRFSDALEPPTAPRVQRGRNSGPSPSAAPTSASPSPSRTPIG